MQATMYVHASLIYFCDTISWVQLSKHKNKSSLLGWISQSADSLELKFSENFTQLWVINWALFFGNDCLSEVVLLVPPLDYHICVPTLSRTSTGKDLDRCGSTLNRSTLCCLRRAKVLSSCTKNARTGCRLSHISGEFFLGVRFGRPVCTIGNIDDCVVMFTLLSYIERTVEGITWQDRMDWWLINKFCMAICLHWSIQ